MTMKERTKREEGNRGGMEDWTERRREGIMLEGIRRDEWKEGNQFVCKE